MSRWKIWLALSVVFGSGLILGSVATGLYVRQQVRSQINSVMAGDIETVSGFVMTHLGRALGLSSEQRTQISPVVRQGVSEIRSLRAQLRPRFETVYRHKAEDIKQHLTAEQTDRLEKILERIHRGMGQSPPDQKTMRGIE